MCHAIFEVNEKTYQSIVFDVIDMNVVLRCLNYMYVNNDFSFTLFLTENYWMTSEDF